MRTNDREIRRLREQVSQLILAVWLLGLVSLAALGMAGYHEVIRQRVGAKIREIERSSDEVAEEFHRMLDPDTYK